MAGLLCFIGSQAPGVVGLRGRATGAMRLELPCILTLISNAGSLDSLAAARTPRPRPQRCRWARVFGWLVQGAAAGVGPAHTAPEGSIAGSDVCPGHGPTGDR